MNKRTQNLKLVIAIGIAISSSVVMAKDKAKKGDSGLSALTMKKSDEANNDVKALKAEIFIASQEDKAIEQAQKLLKKYKGTTLEPDILMRLGELHLRRAKTDRFLEIHRTSEDIVRIAPRLVQNAASKRQILSAIELFDKIEERFPRFDKIDTVVFNNAFANQQIGNNAKAEKKYTKLIAQFENSLLIADAHLAIGEMQFNRQQYTDALKHFQAIRKYPDSQVYPYGIYKAGWAYYNLRQNDLGLKELEDVIRYGKFVKEQGIDARLDLRKEALLDMALFFEDSSPAKNAYPYFEKQAGELDVSPVVLRLADLYKRHSRHQDVKTILTEYIKKNPISSYVPRAYAELMDASEKMRKRPDVVTLLGNFKSICEPSSSWSKAQTPDSLLQADNPLLVFNEDNQPNLTASQLCTSAFQKMALGYANKWLKMWQRDETQAELADSTENSFAIYLSSDTNSAESYKARFVYAELLFKRKKYRMASENYFIAGAGTKDKTIQHDAKYYAIMALEKAVADKWSDSDEKQLKKLASDYLTAYPQGRFALDIEFKVAFVAYEKGKYDEAGPTFLKLGSKFGNSDKGLKAQDLYLDTLNLKKDYVALRDYALQLRGSAKGDRADKMTKIYEESYFLIIQKMEDQKKYEQAINEYGQFAKLNPQSKLTQKALWNITQLYYKLSDLMNAANSSVAYAEKNIGTKEGIDAYMKAAQTYEALGQLREAANVLVQLSKYDKENKSKWSALAADFYYLSGDLKSAKPIFEMLKASTDNKNSFHALVQLEKIAATEKREKVREGYLREISSTGHQPEASEAAVYFVELAYNNKKYDDAFNLAKKLISQEKNGASKSALAQARYVQAKVLQQEYYNQSVKSQLERVQTVLTLKTEKLSKAQIAFQSAAQYGDPLISVKAYSELANCYLHYNESLQNMPMPKGLPEAEATAFKNQMNELAIPMEEKGIETKMQALKVAQQLGVHDPIVTDLQNEMKKMNQQVVKETAIINLTPAEAVLPRYEGVGT